MAQAYCRNCGVALRRILGRWRHVANLGPVACERPEPEPEPEPKTEQRSLRARWKGAAMWREGVVVVVLLVVFVVATFVEGLQRDDLGLVGLAAYVVPAVVVAGWLTWKVRSLGDD